MIIECVWEHNGGDSLLYSSNFIGAFTRSASKEEALSKMPREIASYCAWLNKPVSKPFDIAIIQEKQSDLNIKDADSDVLFDTERAALTEHEYESLKAIALKSAADLLMLYTAFPNKEVSVLSERDTFYGKVPRTADEMYLHTKNVNSYYWGEIGIDVGNDGSILDNRSRGFEALQKTGSHLDGAVFNGSYGEEWSLSKVLRRFIWHDRIHAKAMYRMGIKTFGKDVIPNVFRFEP